MKKRSQTRAEKAARQLAEIVNYLDHIRPRSAGQKNDLFGSWACGCMICNPNENDPENTLKYTAVVPCEAHRKCLIREEYDKLVRKVVKVKKGKTNGVS